MAYFKDTSIVEFQACVPVAFDFSLNRVMNSVLAVGLKWVKPVIGAALFNELDTKYNAGTLNAKEQTAVKLIQQVVANLVFGQDMSLLGSVVDNSGVYVNKSADKWVLGDLQLAKVEERYWERGIDALEDLVNFLNETADGTVFSSYYQSAAQVASTEIFVPNAEVFSVVYQIWRQALTYSALKGFLADVQGGIIKQTLADAYASVVSPTTDKKKTLLKLVREAMVYLALASGVKLRKIKVAKDSVTILMERDQVRGMQTPTLADVMATAAAFEGMGMAKIAAIEAYLIAEAEELGYVVPESSVSSINKKEFGLYYI